MLGDLGSHRVIVRGGGGCGSVMFEVLLVRMTYNQRSTGIVLRRRIDLISNRISRGGRQDKQALGVEMLRLGLVEVNRSLVRKNAEGV